MGQNCKSWRALQRYPGRINILTRSRGKQGRVWEGLVLGWDAPCCTCSGPHKERRLVMALINRACEKQRQTQGEPGWMEPFLIL